MEFKGIDFLANYGKNGKVSIFDLYTDLYIKNYSGLSGNAISLEDFVSSERGIIIKGEPGAGKSTFVKYFVRYYIENRTDIIPFIISLENLGRYLTNYNIVQKKDAEEILIKYLRDEYPQPQFLFNEESFRTIFYNMECWFFFDGFDEINSNTSKEKIIHIIKILFDIWDECKFVITSRPYALDEFTELENFQSVYIDVLNRSQMEKYINALSSILNVNQYTIDDNGLINLICKKNTIYQLARTPVMLTFICIIYFSRENIPESRYEIFEKIIIWLISSKVKCVNDRDEQARLYSRIAYYMSVENETSIKEIEENDLYEEFGETQKSHEFIKKITDTGILIKKNIGMSKKSYLFWHYCFQEFLAARYLADELIMKKDFQIIIDKWFEKDFQEIIVLLSSKLLHHNPELMKRLINHVSKYLCSLSLEQTIKGAGLIGKIMEEVFPDVTLFDKCDELKTLKGKLKSLFYKPILQVGINDVYNAAVAYGLSGDERLKDFDQTFARIESGKFYIGAQNDFHWARNFNSSATEFEVPIKQIHINEFSIRKYPITVEEYEKFVISEGYCFLEEIWTSEGIEWRQQMDIIHPRNWRNQLCLRNSPVTGISWYEAKAYCNWLTATKNDDYIYRLPTEAEWEYAYKFSHNEKIYSSTDINCYVDSDNISFKTPVGMFSSSTASNGLADMLGNVEEWCEDSWSTSLKNCYSDGRPWIDDKEPGAVTRGGSTIRTLRLCRCTYRARCNKDTRYDTIGFRIIKVKR